MKSLYALSISILMSCNLQGMWLVQSACKLLTSHNNGTPTPATNFNNLPSEVVVHIATFLQSHDIRNLRCTNRLCASVDAPVGLCQCNDEICKLKRLVHSINCLDSCVKSIGQTDAYSLINELTTIKSQKNPELIAKLLSLCPHGSFAEALCSNFLCDSPEAEEIGNLETLNDTQPAYRKHQISEHNIVDQ